MKNTWVEKTGKEPLFTFAPDWYVAAKKDGASKEQLFELVRDFCRKALEKDAQKTGEVAKEPSDLLVEVTIASYES